MPIRKYFEITCDSCGWAIHVRGGAKSSVVKQLKRDGYSIKNYWKEVSCPDCAKDTNVSHKQTY